MTGCVKSDGTTAPDFALSELMSFDDLKRLAALSQE